MTLGGLDHGPLAGGRRNHARSHTVAANCVLVWRIHRAKPDMSNPQPNGFGEFQPLDRADTPDAWAKNRRIEIQLTNR